MSLDRKVKEFKLDRVSGEIPRPVGVRDVLPKTLIDVGDDVDQGSEITFRSRDRR